MSTLAIDRTALLTTPSARSTDLRTFASRMTALAATIGVAAVVGAFADLPMLLIGSGLAATGASFFGFCTGIALATD